MANTSRIFPLPVGAGGSYTSLPLEPATSKRAENHTRGVIQVEVNAGQITLEMRVHHEALWLPMKVYTQNTIEEIVLANYMRVVATGGAVAWLGETL